MISKTELLQLGESQVLEFKKSTSLMKECFTALCGMLNANSARGIVVYGVGPDGTIVGLENINLDSTQQTFAHHANQKLDPPLQLQIYAESCESKPILLVAASRSRAVPFHEYDGRAHIRQGSSTKQLSVEEKQHLSLARNRDLHNGPWTCDQCRSFAGSISCIEVTATGAKKTYRCRCGGEWWPAI